jgi:hypothetical protein
MGRSDNLRGIAPYLTLSFGACPMAERKADNLEPDSPGGQLVMYQDGGTRLQVRLDGQTAWLSRIQISDLYQTTPQNITMHIAAIYSEGELSEAATSKDYLLVQKEAGRDVRRSLLHYSLPMILAIGYRVRSARGTTFRQWAASRLSELLVKGFTLDDERIKAGRGIGGNAVLSPSAPISVAVSRVFKAMSEQLTGLSNECRLLESTRNLTLGKLVGL